MEIIKNNGGAREYFLDLLFPSRCPFCGGFIEYDLLCCEECFNGILWADENICPVCGKPLISGCICGKTDIYYDACVPAAYYADKAKQGIYNLKYCGYPHCGEIFGRVIRDRLSGMGLLSDVDAAIPVPMTRLRRNVRGYNQSEMIAKAVVRDTDIALETGLLVRRNVKREQHFLGARERFQAVSAQYFAESSDAVRGKTVLLVDDVLTTGATVSYCSYLLKEKLGAGRVICAAAVTV
ncbi:MAG: double zinc ribbon domain-containing protein [Ruminococcus sp.]|nr:double zinc ribbon domain-containing protein [Ruminococcus sp.]